MGHLTKGLKMGLHFQVRHNYVCEEPMGLFY
jgi:hypothetical protein